MLCAIHQQCGLSILKRFQRSRKKLHEDYAIMNGSYWSMTWVAGLDFVKGKLVGFKQKHRALTKHTEL